MTNLLKYPAQYPHKTPLYKLPHQNNILKSKKIMKAWFVLPSPNLPTSITIFFPSFSFSPLFATLISTGRSILDLLATRKVDSNGCRRRIIFLGISDCYQSCADHHSLATGTAVSKMV